MARPLSEILDEVDDILLTDQGVPNALVVELFIALPATEQRGWIAIMLALGSPVDLFG